MNDPYVTLKVRESTKKRLLQMQGAFLLQGKKVGIDDIVLGMINQTEKVNVEVKKI